MGDSTNQSAQSGSNIAPASQSTASNLSKINRDFQEKAIQEKAKELNLPYIDVAVFPINPDVLKTVSKEEAEKAFAMPFFKSGKSLKLAVVDPGAQAAKDLAAKLASAGYGVQINLCSATGFSDALKIYDSERYAAEVQTKNVVQKEEINYEKELENLAGLKDKLATLPAEEALNLLHVSAIKAGASDLHYQPEEKKCILRFRIDGILHTVFEIALSVYENLANQIKYKAKMRLNVKNIPQDGRFDFIVNERKIDVRVASLPTEFGEAIVCRILDSGKHFGSFEELGFGGKQLEILKATAEFSQGLVLVTGPTSSGKTTTLYVLLTQFNKPEVNIITLEDPVEYHLAGITQSQINEKKGYDFAGGLRSILRQDPDVVMIGEIRDLETAQVAAQAALTGHVVISTLHTNGAVDTISRLTTIGLPAFVIAPSLSVVIAQRLVRRLCEKCAAERPVSAEEKTLFEKTVAEVNAADPSIAAAVPQSIKTSKGCEVCNNTGFRGQMVISEVLAVDTEIKDAILHGKTASEIFALARKKGMITMQEDGLLKVIKGLTVIEEIHRVISA